MTTDMITVKMDDSFLKEIDEVVKTQGYQNRTEFIRNALREKVEEAKLKQAMIDISKFKGNSKKKTTEAKYELVREKAFEELSRTVLKKEIIPSS